MSNFTFGNYLYELRTKKGMSQSELAEILGVTNKAVSKWETGAAYPSSKLIYPLAKALDVSIEELYRVMSESEKEKNPMRKILDFLFKRKVLSAVVPLLCAALVYLVFILFGEGTDKLQVIGIVPVVCSFIFGGMFLILYIQVKNPLCPDAFLDFGELFFLTFFSLVTIPNIVMFFINVKEGFTVSSLFGFIIWSAVSVVHNKRKH